MVSVTGSAYQAGTIRPRSPENLWEEALKKLDDKSKASIQNTGSNRRDILEEVLSIVQAAEQISQQKRWKWTNRKGITIIVRDVFAKMVVCIRRFKEIGDTLIQYDTGHAALPWAAARFLLLVSLVSRVDERLADTAEVTINDVETNGAMLEGLELVFHLIARFEIVQRLYLNRAKGAQTRLNEAIIELYTTILEYLLQARRYYTKNSAVRLAKSIFQLEELTTKYLTNIKRREAEVDKYIRLVSDELLSNTDSAINRVADGLGNLEWHVQDTRDLSSETKKMQDSFDGELLTLQKLLRDLEEPISRVSTQLSCLHDNLKEEQRSAIFDWLSTVPYTNHHLSKSKALLHGSGQWMLQKSTFVEWMESSSSSILWLHGIPGSGKSMLVARLIDYLQERKSREMNPATVAYFYCARNTNEPERSDPTELLRSILKQLSSSEVELPNRAPVVNAYLSRKKAAKGRNPERPGLKDTVKLILQLLEEDPATIVIDGLDECDPSQRQALLNGLQAIIRDSNNVVKVFVSSRDDHELVHRLSQTPNLYIDANDNMEDISRFVKSRVNEAIYEEKLLCGQVPKALRDAIINCLIGKAGGMFRLVSLHIESLCNPQQIKTVANFWNALEHLPRDLTACYDTVLSQIMKSQEPNPTLAERTLKWLLTAQESLESEAVILAVCTDKSGEIQINRSDLLSICCDLVIYDQYTNKFRFAHLSVREYLENLDGYSMTKCNALAAEQCLSWILSESREFVQPPISFEAPVEKPNSRNSLSRHADIFWASYCYGVYHIWEESRLKALLEKFIGLQNLLTHPYSVDFHSWSIRLPSRLRSSTRSTPIADPIPFALRTKLELSEIWPPNPIFVACAFNLSEIVCRLIQDRCSISTFTSENWRGMRVVQVAARCNSIDVLDVLLRGGQRFLLPKDYWYLALFDAARSKNHAAVHAVLGNKPLTKPFEVKDEIVFLVEAADRNDKIDFILDTLSGSIKENQEMSHSSAGTPDSDGTYLIAQLSKFEEDVQILRKHTSANWHLHKFNTELVRIFLCSSGMLMKLELAAEILYEFRKRPRNRLQKSSLPYAANNFMENGAQYSVESADPYRMENAAYYRMEIAAREALERLIVHYYQTAVTKDKIQIKVYLLGVYAYAVGTDSHDHLAPDLIRQTAGDLEFTALDAIRYKGSKCFLLLLRMQQAITDSIINVIISNWAGEDVKHLLTFRSIKITDQSINTAAGNTVFGRKIMQLLLDKEQEENN